MLSRFFRAGAALIAAATVISGAALAQDTPVIYGVQDSQVVAIENGATRVIADPGVPLVAPIGVSPDGRWLAYFWYTQGSNLDIVDLTTGEVRQIAQNTAAGYPFSFSEDGQSIVYAMQGASVGMREDGSSFTALDIYTQPLDGGEPTIVSTTVGVGCGGGSPMPTDQQYGRETNGFGGFSLILAQTPYGMLYSGGCAGNSVALLAGDMINEFMAITRAVLSPDRTQVAALNAVGNAPTPLAITVINLADGTSTEIPVTSTPDRLAWSADGSAIYYSTQAFDTSVPLEGAALEKLAWLNMTSYNRFAASLHRVEIASGAVTDLFQIDAFAIGQIIPTEDAVYVSAIANLDAWVEAIASGEYDPATTTEDRSDELVPIRLYRAPLDGGTPDLLVEPIASVVVAQ